MQVNNHSKSPAFCGLKLKQSNLEAALSHIQNYCPETTKGLKKTQLEGDMVKLSSVKTLPGKDPTVKDILDQDVTERMWFVLLRKLKIESELTKKQTLIPKMVKRLIDINVKQKIGIPIE